MNLKRGDISTAITLIVSLALIIGITINVINMIIPFVWYQKLENIANKYVYVIERFGYLTDDEESELYKELKNRGFDLAKISAEFPKSRLSYGKQFEFSINYEMKINFLETLKGTKHDSKNFSIHVKKYSYSKM